MKIAAACCGMRHVAALNVRECNGGADAATLVRLCAELPKALPQHCHRIALRRSKKFTHFFEPVPNPFRSVPSRCEHDPHEGRGWNRRCGGGCQAHSHLAQGAIPSTLEHSTFHTSACAFAACLQHACSMLACGCGSVLLRTTSSPFEHFIQEIRMVQMMDDDELFTYAKDSGIG